MDEELKKQCDILFEQIQSGNNHRAAFELGVLEGMIMFGGYKVEQPAEKAGEIRIVEVDYKDCELDDTVYLKYKFDEYDGLRENPVIYREVKP